MKTLPTVNTILELGTTDAFGVLGPDLRELPDPLASVARDAIEEAQGIYGGEYYTNDGDLRLDMESVAGDLEGAIGYVLQRLTTSGAIVLVIRDEEPPDEALGDA